MTSILLPVLAKLQSIPIEESETLERGLDHSKFELPRDVPVAPPFAANSKCHVLANLIEIGFGEEFLGAGTVWFAYAEEPLVGDFIVLAEQAAIRIGIERCAPNGCDPLLEHRVIVGIGEVTSFNAGLALIQVPSIPTAELIDCEQSKVGLSARTASKSSRESSICSLRRESAAGIRPLWQAARNLGFGC